MNGEAPQTVTAVTQQIKPDVYPKVDDEATIVLTYPHAQAILQASWNWPVSRKDIELYGKTGYLIAPNADALRLRRGENVPEETVPLPARSWPTQDEWQYLAAVVRGKVHVSATDRSSLENNVTVVRILDAARRSARTGTTVRLDGR
jgi:predicted dehydrogenase